MTLCDYNHLSVFNKVEVFCFLRPRLVSYFKDSNYLTQLLLNPKENSREQMQSQLREPLSRANYDFMVKHDLDKAEGIPAFKLSEADEYAISKMKDLIKIAQIKYQ